MPWPLRVILVGVKAAEPHLRGVNCSSFHRIKVAIQVVTSSTAAAAKRGSNSNSNDNDNNRSKSQNSNTSNSAKKHRHPCKQAVADDKIALGVGKASELGASPMWAKRCRPFFARQLRPSLCTMPCTQLCRTATHIRPLHFPALGRRQTSSELRSQLKQYLGLGPCNFKSCSTNVRSMPEP